MRYIPKSAEPAALRDWRGRSVGGATYDRMPGDVRMAILDSLLNEQGGLCAYTGRRIVRHSSHIEHLLPQAHCTLGADISYGTYILSKPTEPIGTYCRLMTA